MCPYAVDPNLHEYEQSPNHVNFNIHSSRAEIRRLLVHIRMNDLEEFARLWEHAGFPASSLSRLVLGGDATHYLASGFRVTSAATISIALSAMAASEIYRLRTGQAHPVHVHRRDACLEFDSPSHFLPRVGELPLNAWDPVSGLYPTAHGGFVRVHANFPHHKDGILRLLQLPSTADRASVAAALLETDAVEFETLATSKGMCVAACRSPSEWASHPMGQHLQQRMEATQHVPFAVVQGQAPFSTTTTPFNLPALASPPSNCLTGLRVLSLTRVIAGPVAGRTLASHGADVLWVTAPHLPSLPACDGDTSRGKRTIQLDFRNAQDLATFHELVQSADVFIDAYRPNALAECFEGLDKASLHAMNPSLIVASLSAYGTTGPWANKRGFDSLVQTATGLNVAEARHLEKSAPTPLPVQALDHASGYLLAFGILAALHSKLTSATPSNTHVEVCLAWTAEWLRHLGMVKEGEAVETSSPEDIQRNLEVVDMGTHQASSSRQSETGKLLGTMMDHVDIGEEALANVMKRIMPTMDARTVTLSNLLEHIQRALGAEKEDLKPWKPLIKVLVGELLHLCPNGAEATPTKGGHAAASSTPATPATTQADEGDDDESDGEIKRRISPMLKAKSKRILLDDSDDDNDGENMHPNVVHATSSATTTKQPATNENAPTLPLKPSDTDDEADRDNKFVRRSNAGTKRARNAVESSSDDGSASDDPSIAIVRQRSTKAAASNKQRSPNSPSSTTRSADESDESDDVRIPTKRKPKSKKSYSSDDDGSSPRASKSRRTSKGKTPSTKKLKQRAAPSSAKSSSTGLESLKQLAKIAGVLAPGLYKKLRDATSVADAEGILRDRLDQVGVTWGGKYPNRNDMNALKKKKDLERELDGIDTRFILGSSRSPRQSRGAAAFTPAVAIAVESDEAESEASFDAATFDKSDDENKV
ncbi:hypothetical protein DYB25_001136 [Aphanomyces astaci]|uniref:Uncharacterized protein n=1 Tax=Aphanomyces astaci TaxID=112090 RepID=A0A397BR29_APHAT|nr:hypothetical protein DYB25_001136 [Aphanomyces astaci]